jgi:hypothetical protein
METFHLICLLSQAGAVQRLLRGKPVCDKLAWLSSQGILCQLTKGTPEWPAMYTFRSRIGLECPFAMRNDGIFLFIGDNCFFTVPEDP